MCAFAEIKVGDSAVYVIPLDGYENRRRIGRVIEVTDAEIICAIPGHPALKFNRQTGLCISRGKRGYLKTPGHE